MRVRGSKRRVHLTEVDLEPVEQKPMLRIAPAAASLIWLGSIALATAIYMEWLPARALFRSDAAAPRERSPGSIPGERPRRPVRANPADPSAPSLAPAVGAPLPAPLPGPLGATAGPTAGEDAPAPRESTVTTPAVVPESSRTIRGSYYSDDANWAAGW